MGVVLRVTAGPHEGQEFLVDRPETITVGRSSKVKFAMTQDLMLSREHFLIENHPPLCHLVDLGSTNGTKVNGLRVGRVLLRDGDDVAAGDSRFAIRFTGSTWGDANAVPCPGCGATLSADDTQLSAEDSDHPSEFLVTSEPLRFCDECESRRKRFPKTDRDYLIEQWIGGGGMGEVFRARQISKNRRVAIKMISPGNSAAERVRHYFQREMGVLRNLLMPGGDSHPNIVAFYDVFEVDGQFQLVMEYVDGKDALDWIRGLDRPLPTTAAAQIGRQLLSALDFAHSKGYVHRDVKPSNLLVMGPVHRPRIKLSDFGLAKSFANSEAFTTLTRQGDVGGSTGFISPDHIRDFSDVKEPADIYSAAVTLFYLLTNQYPYLGFDPRRPDTYNVILENPPLPLRAFRPDAPEGLEKILLKALHKQPRDRWKSAKAMAMALQPFLFPIRS
jgi:serine/threonine-protein kinase